MHKKGDVNQVNNYRGITLLSHVSKIFTSLLNNRLLNWSKTHNVITDAQFGFKFGFSTNDAICILHSLVHKTLSQKRRSYIVVSLITVKHLLVFRILICGLNLHIMVYVVNVIYSLYQNVKSCVKLTGVTSDFFRIFIGLMQGESLSPFLFSLFTNDLENSFSSASCQGYELGMLNIFLLMYADDTVLISESPEDLQCMLDCLELYTTTWKLNVNIQKTKIMVFRSGARQTEKIWFYNGVEVDQVNCFCYLGLNLNYNGSFVQTQKVQSQKGRKVKASLCNKVKNLHLNIVTSLSLFDSYVDPVLNYGSEVWAFCTGQDVEKVHTDYLRFVLRVFKHSSNVTLYSETGRFPLILKRKLCAIKYWAQILSTENCILKASYEYLYNNISSTHRTCKNWAASIKDELYKIGLGEYWALQSVGNFKGFTRIVKQRLEDLFVQDSRAIINASPKCLLYKQLDVQCLSGLQFYLQKRLCTSFKSLLYKYRTSAHKLNIESGRFLNIPRNERKCQVCNLQDIEDEYHFILICPVYRDLRIQYIKSYYFRHPSMYKLVCLFDIKSVKVLTNLCKYLNAAQKRRQSLL